MMFRHILITASLALASVTSLTPAYAQGTVGLSGDVMVIKVVEDASGSRETLVEPTSVVPGDRLVFTTNYSNDTGLQVDNFVISNPLPQAVVLTEARGFAVSIDEGENFAALETLSVTSDEGTSRPAELADVTDIRWTIDKIAPGATGTVKFFAAVR